MLLKIGLVTGEYPPMEGGVGAFTQELAKALGSLGHEVHIITDRKGRSQRAKGQWRDLLEPVDIGFAYLHPRIRHWRWSSFSSIVDLVVRYELDLVNIQYQAAAYNMRSPAINLLPWRLKSVTKCVVTFHDLRVPYLFPKAGRLRQAAVRFMARHSHGVIATNASDYQSLTRNCPVPAVEIPIGSNIPARVPDASAVVRMREQLGLNASHCLLGYFGFLNESKGADVLLKALARLDKEFHLVFIGGQTGSSDELSNRAFQQRLQQLIDDLGIGHRIHRTGFVSEAEVSAYLYAADIMVMPYRDGVSLRRGTLMAVLTHGRPLITTTPSRQTPDLVHGQNVFLVPAGDVDALTDGILAMAGNAGLRKGMGDAARDLAGMFTWEKIALRTATFFEQVLSV